MHSAIPVKSFGGTLLTSYGPITAELHHLKIDEDDVFDVLLIPGIPENPSVNAGGDIEGKSNESELRVYKIDGRWVDAVSGQETYITKKLTVLIDEYLKKQSQAKSEKEAAEAYNRMILFENPYQFNCIVHKKHLLGKIIGKHNHSLYHIFVIEFSDKTKIKVNTAEGEQGFYLFEENEQLYQKHKAYLYASLQDLKLFFKNGGSML